MTSLELLANELASLSNNSLLNLSTILVRDYPTRADVLETQIANQFQDQVNQELGELQND